MGEARARTTAAKAGITLDAGALIALDRGDKRMVALLREAAHEGYCFRVPSSVLGQAWRNRRFQVRLARFLSAETVEVVPLDEQLARACGELCGATHTSDIGDASVVIVARQRHNIIVTSDPHDLRRLDPAAQIVSI